MEMKVVHTFTERVDNYNTNTLFSPNFRVAGVDLLCPSLELGSNHKHRDLVSISGAPDRKRYPVRTVTVLIRLIGNKEKVWLLSYLAVRG